MSTRSPSPPEGFRGYPSKTTGPSSKTFSILLITRRVPLMRRRMISHARRGCNQSEYCTLSPRINDMFAILVVCPWSVAIQGFHDGTGPRVQLDGCEYSNCITLYILCSTCSTRGAMRSLCVLGAISAYTQRSKSLTVLWVS